MKASTNVPESLQWIKTQPVDAEKCLVDKHEDFLSYDNLLAIFEHRSNMLLQENMLQNSSLQKKHKKDGFEAWNHLMPFNIKALALSFAELFCLQ